MSRQEYIDHYIKHYKQLGKKGSGAGLVDKAERLRLFGYNDDMTLLDYGCGWGAILGGVSPKDYYGVDIVPQAIEMAKLEYPDRKFGVLQIGKLKTKKFDAVISLSVFTHTRSGDVDDCLADISNSVKKGGLVILDYLEGGKPKTEHVQYWKKEDFINKLNIHGLEVEEEKKYQAVGGYEHTYLKLCNS